MGGRPFSAGHNTQLDAANPQHDPASALVYQANGSEVTDVFVDGSPLLRNGQLSFLTATQERELAKRGQAASAAILRRAGITPEAAPGIAGDEWMAQEGSSSNKQCVTQDASVTHLE